MSTKSQKAAATIIADGGVVAYPTESCFGLGCDPRCHTAVSRILQLKRRHWRMGLILIAADELQLAGYINVSGNLMQAPRASWPGPYTWLLPAKKNVSRWLRGDHDTIAVRIPSHRGCQDLCRYTHRAIVSTSANVSGQSPARSAAEIEQLFGNSIDYILDGPLGDLDNPTEIRDAVSGEIVRAA